MCQLILTISEWVFSFQGTFGLSSLQSKFNKNPPVSRWPRRRTLVVLAGLPTVRFDFSVFYTAGLGQKNTPLVSQRGIKDDSILFSVNCYSSFLVTIWVTANASKSLCCDAERFHGFPHLKTVFPFLFSDCYWVKSIESLLTRPCLFKYLY